MSSLSKLGLIACIGAALAAPVAAQDSVDLSFEDARVLGRQAVTSGNPVLAIQISDGLLQADDTDPDAWLIRAGALLQTGEYQLARQAAATAYRLAPNNTRRYEAARIAALAAANDERLTLAQLWLRRALTVAPDDAAEEQTLRDAAQVRRQNPLGLSFSVSLVPSRNATNGAETSDFLVDGESVISEDFGGLRREVSAADLALPGVRGTFRFGADYRLSEDQTQRTALAFDLRTQYVWLFDDAKDISETSRNSDFSASSASISLQHLRALDNGTATVEGKLGATDTAGELTTRFAALSISRGFSASETLFLRGEFELQRNWAVRSNGLDSTRASLRGLAVMAVGDGDRLSLSFGLDRNFTDGASGNSSSVVAQITYAPDDMIGPARVRGSVGAVYTDWSNFAFINGFTDENRLFFVPGGRQDTFVFANLTASFPEQSYAGFTPVISVDMSDRTSDLTQFEGTSVSVGFNVQSQF